MSIARHLLTYMMIDMAPSKMAPRGLMRIAALTLLAVLSMMALAACNDGAASNGEAASVTGSTQAVAASSAPQAADPGAAEVLPTLDPVTLGDGEKLRVLATTSLVAEVARRVGGEAIEVTTLMPLGIDPHSYVPTPQDLRTLNEAHLILINGLGLEEALMPVLGDLDTPVPVVSVNAGLAPLTYGDTTAVGVASSNEPGNTESTTHQFDPHTWLSVSNVQTWVENIVAALSVLDTANVNTFLSNAGAYQGELTALDAELREQIETLPAERRKLVSDHLELNYFAQDYGFEVIGAVIPGTSTMTEPSAQELAALQDAIQAAGVDAIFVGESVSADVVSQLAEDLGLEVVLLYTSSLTEADGPAPDYASLMRYNVNAIVTALAE